MPLRIALAFLLTLATSAPAQYITGPRGGCYTVSASGNKRYVDRSFCGSSSTTPTGSFAPAPTSRPAVANFDGAATAEQEAGRRLVEWFKKPAEGTIERAVKVALAKRLGLISLLSTADRVIE